MKIRIEVEVGPTELREFLGLPDISELQDDVISSVRKTVASGASGLDPVSLFKTWVPTGLLSVTEWQDMLRRAVAEAQVTTTPKSTTRKGSRKSADAADDPKH